MAAFQDGGYGAGPRAAAVAAIPEPSGFMLLTIGLCGLLRLRSGSHRAQPVEHARGDVDLQSSRESAPAGHGVDLQDVRLSARSI